MYYTMTGVTNKKLPTYGAVENVRVVIRVRPFNDEEKLQKCENVVTVQNDDSTIFLTKTSKQTKTFQFNHVFDQASSQIDIYQKIAYPIVQQVFKGYNGTIFAYGQTGSGKTYTMSGIQTNPELKGIIPNTFSHIFGKISSESEEKSFVVSITCIEIYNEEIRDLFATNSDRKLHLREAQDTGIQIKDLVTYTVDSMESVSKLINVSSNNRKTRDTLMNECSSRSHAIFTTTIEAKDKRTNKVTVAKLNLVDLAGSERVKKTRATGMCLREAVNINQSLFVLSNVISALIEEKSTHIPYRNSKLTRLLQDSLGGNSKTAIIATISPSSVDYEESLCTLRYASRAKLIKNCVHLNVHTDKALIVNFENELHQLKETLAAIEKKEFHTQKAKCNVSAEHKLEMLSIQNTKKELNDKIAAIESKILIGGQNMFDKAEEQIHLLESSFEEIQKLDKSQQELEERLEGKAVERNGLKHIYGSLQEEDKCLDIRLEKAKSKLLKKRAECEEQHQSQQADLKALFDINSSLTSQLRKACLLIRETVPPSQWQKVFAKTKWNDELCDYEIEGIAHVGNNLKPKRDTKRFPQSLLMETLANRRNRIDKKKRFVQSDNKKNIQEVEETKVKNEQ